ncbi:MAG: SpoIIE family protein phosphatase [Solirubrobacterales bacterium]
MGDGRTPSGGRERIGFGSSLWSGLVPALIALGGLAILDLQDDLTVTGFFAIVPLTAALSANPRVTGAVAVVTVALAAVSGTWNHNFDTTDFWVRLALIVAACLFSYYVAATIERSNRTARRLELLDRVAASTSGEPTLAEALRRVSEIAVPELADICIIDGISGDRLQRLEVRAAGPDAERLEAGLGGREPTIPDELFVGREADLGPVLRRFVGDRHLRSMAHSDADLAFLRSLGVRSYISVALRSRGRRIGALTLVQSLSGRRQGEEDARFSNLLADRVALALDNAGLFSDLESVERRMDTVMTVLDEPVAIIDRAGRLVFANDAIAALAGAASRAELLAAGDGGPAFDVYDEDGGIIARDRMPWEIVREQTGRVVRLVQPLHGEETWVRVRSRDIEGGDGRAVYTVAAFEDVTEMKFAEFAQSVFASIGELLEASMDPDLMLERLVRLLVPRLADASAVLLPARDGTLVPAAVADVDPDRERALHALIDRVALRRDAPGMAAMLASREPIVAATRSPEGWPEAAEPLAAGLQALGVGSAMGQPLLIGNRLVGVIGFANRRERRDFTALDQRVALRISERVALAIENARIARERSEIADTLQKSLRPPGIPSIPGWSLAALYAPAGSENQAGGDFYDLLRIEDGWMAVVGDVTGHGAWAASLTALARHTLRTASSLTNDPHRALAELNRALLERAGGALCSVAVLTLDQPATGAVRVALAGHPPPLLIRGGAISEVHPAGPVLGAFEDASWEIATLRLDPGDRLLVYTDGVVEARGRDGRFGQERLSRLMRPAEGPEETIRRVRGELEAFAADGLDDDAAALAVMLDVRGDPGIGDHADQGEHATAQAAVSAP